MSPFNIVDGYPSDEEVAKLIKDPTIKRCSHVEGGSKALFCSMSSEKLNLRFLLCDPCCKETAEGLKELFGKGPKNPV